MKSILDPTFRYTNSVTTDLRKTFARVRREQRAAEETKVVEHQVINLKERSKAK